MFPKVLGGQEQGVSFYLPFDGCVGLSIVIVLCRRFFLPLVICLEQQEFLEINSFLK